MCFFFSHDCMMLSQSDQLKFIFQELKEETNHVKLLSVFYGIVKEEHGIEINQIPEKFVSNSAHGILFTKPILYEWCDRIDIQLEKLYYKELNE